MKIRIALFSLLTLCLALTAIPAMADVYNNGPINGTTDAWTINSGFVVSNSFHCCHEADGAPGAGSINGISFGAWLFPGDVLESVEVSITSDEFGGTTFFDGVVNMTQSNCTSNQYGFDVCTETGTFAGVSLSAGDYWLNLGNATVANGDPVYWDENSGPSSASESSLGTIPSEAFTILGSGGGGGTTPEPGTFLMFGSGIVGIGALLRRKLNL